MADGYTIAWTNGAPSKGVCHTLLVALCLLEREPHWRIALIRRRLLSPLEELEPNHREGNAPLTYNRGDRDKPFVAAYRHMA